LTASRENFSLLADRKGPTTSTGLAVKLIAYLAEREHIDIRPAPVERAWMEATDQRFAYRCLPLNIANAFGWEILCPSAFTAAWDGGKGIASIQVAAESGVVAPAISHFMHGILTFHVHCLFRTEPGYDLMVQGPHKPAEGPHRTRLAIRRWKASRGQFNDDLKAPGSERQAQRWQKHYYRGVDVDGVGAPVEDHRTRIRLKPFAKKS
jgi:Family of unknown function (DUF6065)